MHDLHRKNIKRGRKLKIIGKCLNRRIAKLRKERGIGIKWSNWLLIIHREHNTNMQYIAIQRTLRLHHLLKDTIFDSLH